MKNLYYAGVLITQESYDNTRQWFANNAQGCINEAMSGEVFVNDLPLYIEKMLSDKEQYVNDTFEVWMGFLQRAHYIQTGESIALVANK